MRYYTKDGKYVPQFGDKVLTYGIDTISIVHKIDESKLLPVYDRIIGLSFNSFNALIENNDLLDQFFDIGGSGGQGGFDVVEYGFNPEKGDNFVTRNKNESLEEFFLRVALEVGLLIKK